MDKVRIGIIGTGFARKVQIPAFRSCEGAEIVSVASASLDNARSAAEEFDVSHYTDDWRETVSRDDVDLVCITTPPRLHREMALAAVANGKHILCEKPMAMDASEALEMTEAARRAGVLALIDHELRFQPGRLHAYKMIRDGAIGKVRHAKTFFQAPHRADASLPWNWWSDADEGGGALGAIGSHVIDSFRWFLGTDVSSVFGQLQSQIKSRPLRDGAMKEVTSDDESLLVLRFHDSELVNDATGLISISMTEYPEYKHRVEFYGSEGAIAIEARGEVFLANPVAESEWQEVGVDFGAPIPGVPDTGFSSGFTEFAPKIIETLLGGETIVDGAATFEDGLEIQRVLDAARESDRTGRAAELGKSEAAQ